MDVWWRVKRFCRRVARCFAYMPLIWKSEEWDWYYLFELMEFKLHRMERYHRKYSYHLYADRYAKQMLICRNLLNRLRNDSYCEKEYDDLEKKWGNYVWGKTLTRENIKTDEDKKAHWNDLDRLHKKEALLQKNDLEYFCRLLRKHVRHWWY